MAIDWQSLLKRYMALNYVPLDGEAAREFSAEELAALQAIQVEHIAAAPPDCGSNPPARPPYLTGLQLASAKAARSKGKRT